MPRYVISQYVRFAAVCLMCCGTLLAYSYESRLSAVTSQISGCGQCFTSNGTQVFSSGRRVRVIVRPADSDLLSFIFFQDPVTKERRFIGVNHEPGGEVCLGPFSSGTELVFGIEVSGGPTFFTGPDSRNPDSLVHAQVKCESGKAIIGFEDSAGPGSDRDFNDAVIEVSCCEDNCNTLCFRSPQYYLLNLTSLPPGVGVEVGGTNFNAPTRNLTAIKLALKGGTSPLKQFNKQFVAAQLSFIFAGGHSSPRAYSVLQSPLRCFDLSLGLMALSNGFTLTPSSRFHDLFEQARLALRDNRTADMLVLARLLESLNGNDPLGRCGEPSDVQLLPRQLPTVRSQEFTGPEGGYPPQPKGRTNITEVPFVEGPLTDTLEANIRQAALQDARVRNLLGARFGYISTDQVEPTKNQGHDPGLIATRVSFFSHTNNIAVEAQMLGLQVRSVSTRPGYQPPAGNDEIEVAIALARNDPRLLRTVQGLSGDAMIISFRDIDQSAAHRVLYVSFSREEEDQTRFFAIVDLTDQKVLTTGQATRQ